MPAEISATSSSLIPCSPEQKSVQLDNSTDIEIQWLEKTIFAGLKAWQLAGIILSILLMMIILLCCCVKFRVPRTKQNIEADYVRKRITKSFGKELTKINNNDMDKIDLRKALERVQADLETDKNEPGEENNEQKKKKFVNFTSIFHIF
ncbi:GSCOCG00013398001-RA-CDS [Cotesia congregata]|uniref:Similar to TMIE: Transmembrane inner ear expressed protein (Homo sapiens) n=1 Tax=Cotesia congregata TaxID=51543 RepID=A0A8J2EJS2_COTCN|nr:GSCOCG00013398001-RA-CDS [Cotesia congregata]CAG5075297.1 Similar to TMIE: Transmembrane inner ear expressed protein (Homo sapiens) [Cotesia congregata]